MKASSFKERIQVHTSCTERVYQLDRGLSDPCLLSGRRLMFTYSYEQLLRPAGVLLSEPRYRRTQGCRAGRGKHRPPYTGAVAQAEASTIRRTQRLSRAGMGKHRLPYTRAVAPTGQELSAVHTGAVVPAGASTVRHTHRGCRAGRGKHRPSYTGAVATAG